MSRRWLVPALGASTLLAAGLLVTPAGARAEKGEKRIDRVEVVRMGGTRLGVRLVEVDKDDAARLKLGEERGALVKSVEEGSAAEKAGLQEGDVIVRYQGEAVLSAAQLARLVRETPGGRTVALEVFRDGASRKIAATLGEGHGRVRVFDNDVEVPLPPMPPMAGMPPLPEMPEVPEMPEPPEPPAAFGWKGDLGRHFQFREWGGPRKLGVQYQEISGQLAEYFKLDGATGVLITSVEKDGPAAKAGLKAGDVILKFDGKPVKAGEDLRSEVRRAEGGKEVTVTVQRDGRPVDLKVQLASPESKRAGGVSL